MAVRSNGLRCLCAAVAIATSMAISIATSQVALADILDRPWREYTSPHFRLVSDLDEKHAREHLREIEQFRAVVLHLTGIRPDRSTEARFATRVYVIARHQDYTSLFGDRYAGFFQNELDANYMVVNGAALGRDQRAILFHEYVHFVVREHSTAFYPEWYNEGLAELLSTVHRSGDEIVFGKPPKRLRALHDSQIAIADVIHGTTQGLKWHRLQQFYARAWSLVHYLHNGHLAGRKSRLPQLQAYLELRNEGIDSETAFEQAFDLSEDDLGSEVRRYLAAGRMPVLRLPASDFQVHARIRQRALSADEVAFELADLVVRWDPVRARDLARRGHAGHDDDPRLAAAVTQSHSLAGEFAQGAAVGRAVVDGGAATPAAYLQLGNLLFAWCRSGETESHCAALLAEAQAAYEAGLALEPGDVRLRYGLAITLAARGLELETAYRMLAEMSDERPWHPSLNYDTGVAALKAGYLPEAQWHLTRAESFSHGDGLRARARHMLREVAEKKRDLARSHLSQGPSAFDQ
jgi:hypothetical protein